MITRSTVPSETLHPQTSAKPVAHWTPASTSAEVLKQRGRYHGAALFVLLLAAHFLGIALVFQQTKPLASTHSHASQETVRVNLVSNRSARPETKQVVIPERTVPDKPENKTLVSNAPAERVVAVPQPPAVSNTASPQAEKVLPVMQGTPVAESATVAPIAPVAVSKAEYINSDNTPRQVGQVDCKVPKPEYPRSARRKGLTGSVSVRMTLDETGKVTAIVDRSSGVPELDSAARGAAQEADCQPYMQDGRAIKVMVLQPFHFVPSD